jgi:hypothetical protein
MFRVGSLELYVVDYLILRNKVLNCAIGANVEELEVQDGVDKKYLKK